MEKSTKALLALALLFMAFISSIEGGRDVPRKEEADGGSPLHILTFGLLFPWLWWGNCGGGAPLVGSAKGSGYSGGCYGLGGLISWLAGHPWFRGFGGGGAPTPSKAYNQDVAKQGDTP